MPGSRTRMALEVEVEVNVDVGSTRGRLVTESAPPRAFSGWRQPAEAIGTALATARDRGW